MPRYLLRFYDGTSYASRGVAYIDCSEKALIRETQKFFDEMYPNCYATCWDDQNCHVATVQPANHPFLKSVRTSAQQKFTRGKPKGKH